MFFKKKYGGSVDFIVAGLGNPERKYENTRHNAGFIILDKIAQKMSADVSRIKFKALTGICSFGDSKVLLMKPQTYMNESGASVTEAMNFYKIPPERVIVIFDDISLDVGKMRIRKKGSDGGQRGMRSIIAMSGSDMFQRIKIGIGNKPHPEYDLKDWVLSKFTKEEMKALCEVAEKAGDALSLMIEGETDRAMNKYN
ncbi:MAG: aminoacyl-tRNA hydrolase [Acutalibacteraceae bacterium]